MQREVYLVVVSILEGKNFPKRPKHQLIVECKFDGELLSTDPIDHADTPDFTTELAWELNKRALHQHRMQRTPIKLQCYAVNTTNGIREQIGYVLLDLRLAQQKPQAPKWYNLLSSKYSRLKPAIKIGMALEDDLPTQEDAFKARNAPPRQGKALLEESAGKELIAKLNEDEGFFQIGPADNCYDMFVLSVTVAFAANLEQLIPSDKRIPAGGNAGYFFYYSLLGSDVANDPFPDLLNPEFVPERASVRIRSSADILRLYLAAQPSLQIHLCSGDQSLGSAEIPLNSLLKKGSKEIEIKPVVTEGAFTLCPPNLVRQQLQGVIEAKVGVSVNLRREEISSDSVQTPFIEDMPQKEAGGVLTTGHLLSSDDAAPQDVPERDVIPDKQKKVKDDGKKKKKETPELPRKPLSPETEVGQRTSTPTPPPEVKPFALPHTDDEAESLHLDSETEIKQFVRTDAEQNKKERLNKDKIGSKKVSATDPMSITESSGLTTTATHPVVPPQARHYRFSLHLKSIADLDLPFTCNAFIKYTYPFFGSAAPVLTNPAVEIPRQIETTLPRSLCTFDFACTAPLLHNTFNSVPLIAELWHRDKESSDMLVGAAAIPLPLLMTQEPVKFVNPGDGSSQTKEGIRLSHISKLQMASVQGTSKRIATINVALTLEDYGVVREQKLLVPQNQTHKQSQSKQKSVMKPVTPPPTAEEPRQSAEYQAAIELELWKEQQEEHFEQQLKEKELAHMKSLAGEWQRRDKEREAIVTKRITEYNRLETKLKKSLAEVETREKQLSNNELELARIRTDVQREHERVLAQAKEATNRMKEDCVHQVQLERGRIRILEEENTKLKSHLVDAERKFSAFEQKFQNYKFEQNNMPEVRLQSELQLITLEKNELERKLESVNKSKLHYKQQWGRALKELARLKQREQDHAMANLKRQQEELEQMRLRYFATEEREANKEGQKQLIEIKEELNRLKAKDTTGVKRDPSTIVIAPSVPTRDQFQTDLRMTKADEHIDEHVSRLIEERDTLLRTGVYSREDRIISELDRQIRDAISRKSTMSMA